MFHSFLARQNHAETLKKKHLVTLTRAQVTFHEPELCDTTKAMTEGRQTSDFLKRRTEGLSIVLREGNDVVQFNQIVIVGSNVFVVGRNKEV